MAVERYSVGAMEAAIKVLPGPAPGASEVALRTAAPLSAAVGTDEVRGIGVGCSDPNETGCLDLGVIVEKGGGVVPVVE